MKLDVCLCLEQVRVSGEAAGVSGAPVTLAVAPGELVLVRGADLEGLTRFADLIEGLCVPASGRVSCLGVDWADCDPDRAASTRGRIGRVFAAGGWVSNLDVDENIGLRLRHHTRRSDDDIEQEAIGWASRFGFTELPRVRPSLLRADSRRRAEWVRAFLGSPALIMLEEPMAGVYDQYQSALLTAVAEVRTRGTAVVWLTTGSAPGGLAVTGELVLDGASGAERGDKHDETL